MFWNRGFTIEPEQIPETPEDICFAVAKYCAERDMDFEFEKREYPVIARIDGRRYEITKKYTHRYGFNLWILRCKQIKT